jgi:hypothetical protein
MKNPAAGGGRWVEVPPERLVTWVVTFAERHGGAAPDRPVAAGESGVAVTFTAADGAAAECHPPFPPLPAPASGAWPDDPAGLAGLIAAHATADRTVGVFLLRLGGFAAGVFARRRENQATAAIGAAADTAVKVLVPYAGRLDAVVLGGDRRAISGARADPRLRPVMRHAVDRFLTVPDPRLAVLRDAPRLFLAVRIHLTGPA